MIIKLTYVGNTVQNFVKKKPQIGISRDYNSYV